MLMLSFMDSNMELIREMSNEVLLDGVVFEKTVDGVDYSRCFHCGKFFAPTIINMELQLFCSSECEDADSKHWEKVINESNI